MNAHDRAAIRWALRGEPDLLAELARDLGWYEDQDARQREEERRLAEHDHVPCPHWARTDWLDEQTCGCGEVVG